MCVCLFGAPSLHCQISRSLMCIDQITFECLFVGHVLTQMCNLGLRAAGIRFLGICNFQFLYTKYVFV